jgi:hypothetical protein
MFLVKLADGRCSSGVPWRVGAHPRLTVEVAREWQQHPFKLNADCHAMVTALRS